ncbi:GlsB/YeaQ/YmgE family stress response membrane protein [Rhodoblastus acidophilus]|uniref:GlsB/YeaQ/YmgE family stress response membrane protein n=1 Tax=Rhodoblastus acidophilus TaxID=1074 RepID=A0A6N8DTY9_RHOAC|nr:GlsB/YeaQ/YmgE family stress response membrane protein [Rhodoblastus acidophilus]MCW2275980.1 putative membrane protein YeaQ/YmgE (transglycosylase-associated protein family) [Rhodoblastus acidophilus]MTV32653.1 GlsB/YeaQ/YmgE family stress response membrane protein [Rhodoblastus acidophilus]
MGLLSWIILGAIAGFVGSKLVHGSGQGLLLNVALGIVGALVGGYLATLLGMGGVSGFNLWSVIVSIAGAVIVLVVYRKFSGTSRL